MKFRRKKRENVDIALISMIDVLFVLLLFFMISSTFDRQTQVNIKLPEAEGAQAEEQIKATTLLVDAAGVYSLLGDDGSPHRLAEQDRNGLRQVLSKLAEQSRDLPFIINADGNTPNQFVMTALDVAGQVGFRQITFATVRPAED